jgi:uncharacterized membrane protein YkvA (DUF1232 family)
MKIRTVADLRNYLAERALSPEAFSHQCLISNMTLRRLLAQSEQKTIPQKYWATLDRAVSQSPDLETTTSFLKFGEFITEDFSAFAKTLEEQGKGEHDLEKMKRDISEKNKNPHIGKKLKELVRTLFEAIKNDQVSKKDKVLVIGALLYFLNPIDLIPDSIVGVGYLDDYAALSLVAARVVHQAKSSPGKLKKDPGEQV